MIQLVKLVKSESHGNSGTIDGLKDMKDPARVRESHRAESMRLKNMPIIYHNESLATLFSNEKDAIALTKKRNIAKPGESGGLFVLTVPM